MIKHIISIADLWKLNGRNALIIKYKTKAQFSR